MAGIATGKTLTVEWAVAQLAHPHETDSGDQYTALPLPGGLLLAVIDGLGHGARAAAAARLAAAALNDCPSADLNALVARCHAALAGTRGAVMTLAALDVDQGALAWLGIGNVTGVLVHSGHRPQDPKREHLHLRGGVVGYNLPQPRTFSANLAPGDVLVLATDGIHGGFADNISARQPAQTIADHILAQHGRGGDDALVLVAVCRTPQPEPR
ncbi:MAG: SpoIIE family protein phosphatase [Aggregatilineales bacterium]